ncbi:hypothetical protein SO802_027075 [Lithocarpus litseifolius]|uniref:Peroxidase n=1 Tax=Lithocarpus litseifolius TaxID=425828 RepID=A0AAW2C1E5_9ROSI
MWLLVSTLRHIAIAEAKLYKAQALTLSTNGCDASILVDPIEGNVSSEMASIRNFGIRKRELISIVKSMVEAACPQQVSCADILILAAREAVAMSGGPHIEVPLGRKDSFTAPSYQQADAWIPPATTGVEDMLHIFTSKGMTIQESVALIGAHTLGVTHCASILNRLYKAEGDKAHQEMEPGYEAFLMLNCPEWSLTSNISFVLNDPTALIFDNLYYKNAMGGRGVLRIDAEMVSDPRTAQIVKHFASDRDDFFCAFSSAFVKLSTSGSLNQGVIRKRCNVLD